MILNDQQLDEIRERNAKRTAGEWERDELLIGQHHGHFYLYIAESYPESGNSDNDLDFITNSPTDITNLLETVDALKAWLDTSHGLSVGGDSEQWNISCSNMKCGWQARMKGFGDQQALVDPRTWPNLHWEWWRRRQEGVGPRELRSCHRCDWPVAKTDPGVKTDDLFWFCAKCSGNKRQRRFDDES